MQLAEKQELVLTNCKLNQHKQGKEVNKYGKETNSKREDKKDS